MDKTELSDLVGRNSKSGYRAMLLRCWQEGDGWRFSLEGIGAPGRKQGFYQLEEMIDNLHHELASFIEQGEKIAHQDFAGLSSQR